MTKKVKKTVKIVIACLFVAVLIGFIVCEVWFIFVGFPNHHCGKDIYSIGKDNGVHENEYSIEVENDTKNECFVVQYTSADGHENDSFEFSFMMYYRNMNTLHLDKMWANGKNALMTTDENGDEIVFQYAADYYFTKIAGNKTFYVSYAAFGEQEKEAISKNDYYVVVSSYNFYP